MPRRKATLGNCVTPVAPDRTADMQRSSASHNLRTSPLPAKSSRAQDSDRWSLDFVSDQLTDGRRFRILTVVDDCTRECLALVADTSLSGARVARELDWLTIERGNPTARSELTAG
jgi:transposase InsO family protein